MQTDDLIKTETDADGRTRYTVAGVLVTNDPQEAIDLTQTGVFRIACPMTRRACERAHGHDTYANILAAIERAPKPAHGKLDKFPWE